MNAITSYFDLKSFARKIKKIPDAGKPEERDIYSEYITPRELPECFLKMYSDLLRHDAINIREVDFDSFGEGDLEQFYAFLENYTHDLFAFGETMVSFKPVAVPTQVFI